MRPEAVSLTRWTCRAAARTGGLLVAFTVLLATVQPTLAGHRPGHGGGGGGTPPPVAVTDFRSLEVGDVAGSSNGPGTVTVTPAGGKSVSGFVYDMGGNHRAAEFKVTGPANADVTITLPGTVTLSNGSSTTNLHSFTSSPSGTGTLSSQGKLTIYVGATMDVPANQASGTYDGTFQIFVDEVP